MMIGQGIGAIAGGLIMQAYGGVVLFRWCSLCVLLMFTVRGMQHFDFVQASTVGYAADCRDSDCRSFSRYQLIGSEIWGMSTHLHL